MKLTPYPNNCKKHYPYKTNPCLVIDCMGGKPSRYIVTQTKCSECGYVFEEEKKELT